jgi:hypothetical protein
LALEYLAIASAVGAGGLILLLLLGTQIFHWYWPLVLFVVALGAGLILARRRRLTDYRLAQVVDDRLHLKDRLATVVFFRDHKCSSDACLQTVERQAAEHLAGEDVRRAVPVTVPRYCYVSLALLAAAVGLTGLRYGLLHTLDLEAPIAQIDFAGFTQPTQVQAATKKSVLKERLEEQLRQLGLDVEDNTGLDENAMMPIETQVPGVAEPGKEMQDPSGKRQASSPETAEDGEGSEPGEKSTGDGNDAGDAAASDKPQQGKPQNPPKDPKQGQQGSQDNLMNKMKDALANLLNKMKSQTSSETQETASTESQAKGRQQANEQGMQSKSKGNGEGQPNPDEQGQEGQGEQAPGNQSRAGERSADQPGNQDSKTGMGKQDGAKDIRDAEQLAAMGKLSEIFGKRAQQITGEMSVEVSSSKQHLKTAYSTQRAEHADTGAESNRDEIPLAYQGYIQRYFEEVRKTAPAAKVKN